MPAGRGFPDDELYAGRLQCVEHESEHEGDDNWKYLRMLKKPRNECVVDFFVVEEEADGSSGLI